MSGGEYAKGASLKIDGTPIAGLTNIPTPEMTADTEDVTTHDSPGGWREWVKTLKDSGEFTVEGNIKSEEQITVIADAFNGVNDYEDDDEVSVLIEFNNPADTYFTVKAYVTGLHPGGAPVDGIRTFSATFKCTGAPTIGDGGYGEE